ncbi:Fucose 4-O-acetylase and related acetyltransferases [Campylobacter jejuni]|nr:Fucose 4-O-acetylase and related acetyltransferases [Campylobacter jejuni]
MRKFNKQETLAISYMKAIGIAFVVAGHYTSGFFNVMQPYLFHMPLFFFIGGITTKEEPINFEWIKRLSKKLIPYIVITYLITGLFSVILNKSTGFYYGTPFGNGILSTLKLIYIKNFHNNSLFLVCWFLVAYYFSSILTRLSVTLSNTSKFPREVLLLIGVPLGWFGCNLLPALHSSSHNQIFNILSQVSYGSMFMIVGFLLKNLTFKLRNPVVAVILLMLIGTGVSLGYFKQSAMAWSNYPAGFMGTSIGAFLCIAIVVAVSNILSSNNYSLLKYIGDQSKTIMSYHLSAFASINVFALYIFDFKNIDGVKLNNAYNHYSFIIYTIVGISVPLIGLKIKEWVLLSHTKVRRP